MTGIVLSGGENRRMGKDKAFLKLDGIPLIEHVLRTLRGIFHNIIIVTNTPAAYSHYDDVHVICDALDKRGPLTGIYSGLLSSSEDYNFVVACDMPFLCHDLISYMAGCADGQDIVAPLIDGQVEPLHAIYSKRLLPVVRRHIQQDDQQIQGIYKEAKVLFIREEEINRFDAVRQSFRNLNTPEEYKEAVCLD